MTDEVKAREHAFGKEWGFRSETRSYAEKVQAEYWFGAGWRSALEAATSAPAIDREALMNAITDAALASEDIPEVADHLLASGVLRDVRDVQAEALEQAADDVEPFGYATVTNILRMRAQAIREARNER